MTVEAAKLSSVSSIAQDLLKKDNDGVVTKEEIKEYVKANEDTLTKSQLNANDLINELSDLFKSDKIDEKASKDTKNAANDDEKLEILKAKVSKYNDMLKQYDIKLDTVNKDIEATEKELKETYEKYEKLEKEFLAENDELSKVSEAIEATSKTLEKDTQQRIDSAVWKATLDYDPASDGEDFEKYIAKKADPDKIYSPVTAELAQYIKKQGSLSKIVSNHAAEFKSLSDKIDGLNNNLNELNTSKTSIEDMKTTTTKQKDEASAEIKKIEAAKAAAAQAAGAVNGTSALSGMQAKDCDLTRDKLLSMIPSAEKSLVESSGIDLTEKLADGSPRYVFAKGATKDEGEVYHVYDMGRDGASIPRLYGSGNGTKGTDINPLGNGYIRNIQSGGEGGGVGNIYYVDDCDTTKQYECCCYSTCSPLAFDLEGDGVKTSKQVIDYDIDGDGVKDKINDSADAVLVFDKDGDGISGEDGSEAFGNNTDLDGDGKADGYKDGFEALKALAKKEGLIDGKNDNKLDEKDLKVLQDKYGLGIKKDGYLDKTSNLSDVGITEINLATTDETTMTDNFDGMGNQLMTQKGATFKINGETREYADIWHRKLDEGSSTTDYSSVSMHTNEVLKQVQESLDNASRANKSAQNTMNKDYHMYQQGSIKQQNFEAENKLKKYNDEVEAKEAKEKEQKEIQEKELKKQEETKAKEAEEKKAEKQEEKQTQNDKIEYMKYRYGVNR